MGREVRRVPKDWVHPKNEFGVLQPMYDQSYREAAFDWKQRFSAWERGEREEWEAGEVGEYWDWSGMPPDKKYYRPDWTYSERTHFQMYETTSEGTPISPVCETPEQLARWLADNKASAFAGMTATYEQWLATIYSGSAPSAVITSAGMVSGVEAMSQKK